MKAVHTTRISSLPPWKKHHHTKNKWKNKNNIFSPKCHWKSKCLLHCANFWWSLICSSVRSDMKLNKVPNFSCFLVLLRRLGIDGWHKIEQVSEEMKYVQPTQWPEWWWHFQTHGSMNVYTVWKKLISGQALERVTEIKTLQQKSICSEKQEEKVKAGWILAAGCEGLKSNNYDVGMLFILGIRDTLLFFRIF